LEKITALEIKITSFIPQGTPGFRSKGSKIDGHVTQIFTLLPIIYLLSTKSF